MLFNPCHMLDFMPEVTLNDQQLDLVDEIRLLGLIIRKDLKRTANTDYIVKKANGRLWTLRRLKNLRATQEDLLDVYLKKVRSVLELGVPACHCSLTQAETRDIEWVQKSTLHIVLGNEYISYRHALDVVKL